MVFSTREVVTSIWALVILIAMMFCEPIRESLTNGLKTLFKRFFIVSFLSILLYFSSLIFVLSRLFFWKPIFLKDIIIWFIFIGVKSCYKSITNRNKSGYFKNVITENFKFIVVIEFVISNYTFNIFIELLLFPILIFIIVMCAFAEKKPEYKLVYKVFNYMQTIIGFLILFFACEEAILDYRNFATIDTLISFSIPFVLTFAFLPVMYMFALLAGYSEIFVRIKINKIASPKLLRKAIAYIVILCNFSRSKVKKFELSYSRDLMKIENIDDLNQIVSKFKSKKLKSST